MPRAFRPIGRRGRSAPRPPCNARVCSGRAITRLVTKNRHPRAAARLRRSVKGHSGKKDLPEISQKRRDCCPDSPKRRPTAVGCRKRMSQNTLQSNNGYAKKQGPPTFLLSFRGSRQQSLASARGYLMYCIPPFAPYRLRFATAAFHPRR